MYALYTMRQKCILTSVREGICTMQPLQLGAIGTCMSVALSFFLDQHDIIYVCLSVE